MRVRLVMGALLFAMVLLGSVVVVAAYPTGYYLEQTGTGFAYLSTEQYYSYNTAVKMGTIVGSDRGAIVFSGGPQLSEIYALSYWTYTHQAGTFGQLTAWVAIYLHTEPGKTFAEWVTDYLAGSPNVYYIQAEPYYAKSANPQLDNWEKWDTFDATYPLKWVGLESPDYPHEAPTLADYIDGDAVYFLTPYHGYQSFASREYGSLYIVAIKIRVGWGVPWVNTLAYVDDVTINDYFENFGVDAIAALEDLKTEINDLPANDFKPPAADRKAALIDKINDVIAKIDAGDYKGAIMKLNMDIRPKLDASAKQTWLVEPHTELLAKIDTVVGILEGLL